MGHRLDDPEHGSDDSQGRQSVGHGLDRVAAMQFLVQCLLQLATHQVLDLMRIVRIHADHAKVVADQRRGVMVCHDLGKVLEGVAVGRLLDMRLQRHRATLAGELGEEEQQAQQLDVIGLLVALPFEDHAEAGQRVLHPRHRVGHDEGADRRAQDRQQLERHGCHQRADGTAAGDETAEHAGQQEAQSTER